MRLKTIGVAVAACLLAAVFAAPSIAAKKEKPPVIFGKFHAKILGQTITPTTPATTKGHGSISALRIGPYNFTGAKKFNETTHQLEFGPICEKELTSKGIVKEEVAEQFEQALFFKKCVGYRKVGAGIEEKVTASFVLGINFRSNFSAEIAEPLVEVHGVGPLLIKASKSYCVVEIPEQSIPLQSEEKPEKEYESASYTTEEEKLEGGKGKKYEGGVEKKLNIETIFKKIKSEVQTSEKCRYSKEAKGEGEEGRFNKETGKVEFTNGVLESELEGITLKKGSVWFEPKP
ncbi:MAG: hypothetical protein ACYDC2_01275 [Solirubrobacteraceae bacterium]